MQCLNLQQALFLAQNASLASMKIKKPKLCSGRTTPSRSWNQCNSLVKNNHLSKETVSSLFVTAQLCEDITRKAEIGSFAREYLPIAKRIDFKKNERPLLKEFLQTNETRCCICVLGHYLYADAQTYWSFFDNDDDKVIAVWYLRVPSAGNMKNGSGTQ